jgi:peptidoglycan hydrolase CwlO-like protein
MQSQIEEYEDRLNEMSNSHEDNYNALEEEKAAVEADMQNIITQIQKENEVMMQQIQNKDKYLQELKESYANLQNSASNQTDAVNEKFAKERRDLNEKIEIL